jgi:hypothetical protein
MGDVDDRRHIFLTSVHSERADDFETWLREVLTPAVRKVAPETEARVQTLRAVGESDGVVYFAFVADGGDESDWYIGPLLEAALGTEAAERASREWDAMVSGPQLGGTFRTLTL